MPRNGSGVYSANWTNAAPNTTIESSKQNSLVADLVTDANAARPITAGGTGETTARLKDGTWRFQNTADTTKLLALDLSAITTATTRTLAVKDGNGVIQTDIDYPDAGGTADVLTLTVSPAYASYVDKRVVRFRATETNTGAATLNVSGLGAKAIRKILSGADAALSAGDIQDNQRCDLVYDSSANAGAGAFILVKEIPVSGSNGNGSYVRLPDGTQICWNANLNDQSVETAAGALFETTSGDTWTFPVPFIDATVVVTGATDTSTRWMVFGTPMAASVPYKQLSHTSSASGVNCRAQAVGRWF